MAIKTTKLAQRFASAGPVVASLVRQFRRSDAQSGKELDYSPCAMVGAPSGGCRGGGWDAVCGGGRSKDLVVEATGGVAGRSIYMTNQ